MGDPQLGRDERSRLRRQTKRKVTQLTRNLTHYRFRGPLGRVLREYRFTAEEFEVLSVLLQRTMRAEAPDMEGRLVLGSIFDTSFGVLSGMHLLHENARLRASGLVTVAEDQPPTDDILETRFRLSEDAIDSFRVEVAGDSNRNPLFRRRAGSGYASHRELLGDLRLLHNLYDRRSERVFEDARWSRLQGADGSVGRTLTRQIDLGWKRVQERLAASPSAASFPLVRLMRRHHLDEREVIAVVHLLFREVYEGIAHADTVDLMRLVSASEGDLLRSRKLFGRAGNLVRHELLTLEPQMEGREMTGEAYLNDWVINELLGIDAADDGIGAEDRLNWHLYLRNLEDSTGFFRDMQG